MSILLRRLFKREATVPTTTEDVLAELEAAEQRTRTEQAEAEARQRRIDADYRAGNARTLADFLKRKDLNTQEVNAHVVALLLALTDTRRLVIESANVPFDGTFQTTEQVFGFPTDFADRISSAISEAAPSTQWDFSGEGQPTLKEYALQLPPATERDAAGHSLTTNRYA